jgi:hypothetical protein
MIKIIDGYGFEQDRNGITLFEIGQREAFVQRTKIKTGEIKDYADALGYYGTMSAMLNGLLKHATRKAAEQENVQTIGEYIKIMQNIKSEILDAVKDMSI